MSNAQDRRLEAIGSITKLWYESRDGSRDFWADRIGKLMPLGRTERWRDGVDGWVALVTDTDNPLNWAIIQGAIFMGFKA